MCIAGAIAGAAVVGAGSSIFGATTQANAENNATAQQASMYNAQVGREAPYVAAGNQAQGALNNLLGIGANTGQGGSYGSLNAPFTADTFKSLSPAYQFQMQQGQQGVLNQDSSAQGAESGAALKDLISFNQNYANTSFNNAFQQYQTQQTNTFNRLNSIAQTGESAASNQATGGSNYASGIAGTTVGAGTAAASGAVGASNALTGGATNAAIWAQYGGGGTPAINPNTNMGGTDFGVAGNW
jgi:hypothetical protein